MFTTSSILCNIATISMTTYDDTNVEIYQKIRNIQNEKNIYYFRIKTMFGLSFPPDVCKRAHVLFLLFVLLRIEVSYMT
jgi:hypothetical protein